MVVAPTVLLYVPAAQLVQLDAPALDQVPATQVEQVVMLVAAVADDALPAAQLVHDDEPAVSA